MVFSDYYYVSLCSTLYAESQVHTLTIQSTRFAMGEHLGNPLMDWGNILNYGFIFFLGFTITAAEEDGLGKVMHEGRWKYLVAGFLFSCLRVGLEPTGVIPYAVVGLIR